MINHGLYGVSKGPLSGFELSAVQDVLLWDWKRYSPKHTLYDLLLMVLDHRLFVGIHSSPNLCASLSDSLGILFRRADRPMSRAS